MPILTPEERIGTLLAGRYRIERILGQGGMGVVFAGQHDLTDRRVAIKLLLPQLVSDEDVTARFFQEAKAAAGLDHPNVVDVLDMGTAEGDAYLILEFLDGEPLNEILEARGAIEPAELLSILLPVMDALAAAHERGIVHRDLKPENIFVHRDLRGRPIPKVLDFGIAKLLEKDSNVKTRTGGVLGTPHYMSPEQAQGAKVGAEADVWSMGVLLYECLCGSRPFQAESIPALLMQICMFDPTPLAERATVHPKIAEAVHRAIDRDDARRFTRMEELGGALIAAARAAEIELPATFEDLFPPFRETEVPGERRPSSSGTVTGPLVDGRESIGTDPTMHAEVAQPNKPSRGARLAILAALVALLVVGVAGGAFFMLSPEEPIAEPTPDPIPAPDPDPDPAPAPAPAPDPDPDPVPDPTPVQILRTLQSEPAGAEVYAGEALVGNTPHTVDLAQHEGQEVVLEVRAEGRRPRVVVLNADSAAEVLVSLPRAGRRRRGSPEGSAPALAPR